MVSSLIESRAVFQKHHEPRVEERKDVFANQTLDLLGIERELDGVAVLDS